MSPTVYTPEGECNVIHFIYSWAAPPKNGGCLTPPSSEFGAGRSVMHSTPFSNLSVFTVLTPYLPMH